MDVIWIFGRLGRVGGDAHEDVLTAKAAIVVLVLV
jgi:hypothetical protein